MKRSAVQPILEDYERTLGSALTTWELRCDALLIRLYELHESHDPTDQTRNDDRAIRIELRHMADQVASINATYADRIVSQMQEPTALAFRQQVQSVTHPDLYHETPVDAVMQALSTSDLTEELRSDLNRLQTAYNLRRNELRERYIRAVGEWDSPQMVKRFQDRRRELMQRGQSVLLAYEGNPVAPIAAALYEIEESTCKQMRSLIGSEQLRKLPVEVRLLLDCW